MYSLTGVRRSVAILFLVLLAWVSVMRPADAASIYGSDDFSTGISATRWPINLTNHGAMTVAGTSGRASFLVPGASTDEQNAYLVWAGRPRADADWSAEVRGRNAAAASPYGGSSLQLGVGEARILTGGEGYSFNVEFSRHNRAGVAGADFQYWASPGPDEPIVRISSALSVTNFRLRIIFRAATQRFEVWYEDTGLGTNWKLLRSSPLSEVMPGATPATEFAVALLANTYFGPVTEGQLWADDFRLVNGLLEVPVLTTQPAGQTVVSGNAMTLTVAATGTGLSYQWSKDGVNIPGATGSSYVVASAQPSHSGFYAVVVSNANGGVTSNGAGVMVSGGSIYGSDNFSTGISSTRWPLNFTNHGTMTVAGTNGHASFLVPGPSADKQNAYLVWNGRPRADADWSVDMRGHNAAYSANGGSSLQLGVADSRVLTGDSDYVFNTELNRGGGGQPQAEFQYWISPGPDSPAVRIPTSFTITDFGLRIIYRAANQRFESWYDDSGTGVNWKQISTATLSQFVPDATAASDFVLFLVAKTRYGPVTEGQLWADDFRVVNALLELPVLTTQPANRFVAEGNAVTWSVAATGTGLTYQWRKNGMNIPGATGSSYTVASAQPSHTGDYTVVVSNANGGVTSDPATLTVSAASVYGADDFSTGVSSTRWFVTQTNHGTMTVAGTSGHASFLAPGSSTDEQNAYLVWSGMPRANVDWSAEVRGRNTAEFSLYGASQFQFNVVDVRALTGGAFYHFDLEFARSSRSGLPHAEFQSEISDAVDVNVDAALSVTDFRLRILYKAAMQRFEAWYDDSGLGTNWKLLRSASLTEVVPDGTTATQFGLALLANTYFGPISEGQLWADDFRLVNALLEVPVLTSQPATQFVAEGNAVTLSVAAPGTGLSYQWRKNGVNIPGATGSSLTVAAAQPGHAGSYTVVVSNVNGGVTSNAATLTVQNGSIYGSDDFSTGISATRWPINSTNLGTMTVAGTSGHASFLVPGTATDEQNAYLVWAGRPRADADWSAEVRGHNAAAASLYGGSSLQLGVGEARILTDGEGNSLSVEFSRHNRAGVAEADFQYWASLGPDEPIARIPSALSVTDFRLRILYRAATQRFELWYEDTGTGTNWKLLRSSSLAEVMPDAIPATEFAVALLSNTYDGPVLEGQLWADDFRLVNALLEVPVLTTQPAGQAVLAGNAVTLAVAATGTGLAYQWRKDGVNIPGATGSSHTVASAQLSHSGTYTVVVSNSNGGVTSGGANLAVTKATPVIFTAPTATALTVGQMLSSAVLSGGSASVAGLFSFSAPSTVPSEGVTLQSVTFTPTDSARYTAASTSVSVTANPPVSPPGITSQPASLAVTVGEVARLSVTATGTEPLRYQWRKNGANIVGATGATYSLAAARAADAGSYSLVVTNVAGSVTSSNASLVVNKATPAVLRAPTAASITAGQRVSFSVLSGGSASVAGIFTFSSPATVPSVGTALQPVTFTPADAANYTTASTTVSVTVNPAVSPPNISVQPAPLTVNAGAQAIFRVTATGATALGYQWRKGGVAVAGATGETYTVDVVEAIHAGSYDVVVTDTFGNSVTSNAQRLVVNLPASIVSQPPQLISATIGASVALKVVAGGTGPFTYQWQKNGLAVAGGTSATYLAPTSEVGATQYSVKVTSQSYGNMVESERTTLNVLPGRAISILRAPSPETMVIRGTGAVLKVTADPNPSDALRTTYRLLSYVNNAAGVDAGIGGTVPAGGEVEVPLKGLTAGGSYAVVFSREYADGQVINGVKTAPFAVTLRTFEDAAGTYELLLGDSNGLVGDGANYRGVLLVTVTRTGAVSGRVLYNEAAALPEASGLERTYTAVARAFSGTFTPVAGDSDRLVSSPRLGLGVQANRQALELELDFSVTPVVLNALLRDRISVPPEVDEEGCVSNGFGAVRGVTKLTEVAVGSLKADLSSLVGRYALGADPGAMQGSGPGADNNGTLLAQVLATGKVLWATRLSGFTGSGAATLSTGDRDQATAQLYQGRTLSTTNALSTNSLLGKLCFKRLADGTLWSAGVAVGDGDDKLERQSCYITKSGKIPVFSPERFDLGGVGSSSFNWSGVQLLDFQFGASCRWTGSTAAGLLEFFKPAGAALAGGIPSLYLTAEDPAGEGPYVWTLAVSSAGIVKATSAPGLGVQPSLSLRLDKARGEWVGSYVSPLTKLRRTMVGVVARPEGEDPLRGAGWVELGAIPSTQTSGWRLELASPSP